ncbi:hypothetical protein PPERSA_01639 [Pseudocohnilembus persalinus]|uniref:Uncharacterized protein n=1 Tax=Pseudocohnilembus persalinus TaxID=266149 RepID=A0A0V0R4N1_PSEPJ|nr:hypothetical protein PPERSA_01639 [Pseudocohnilembus persalinus]|eukprot:KRX09439.1 hypothetical protein PPERSA_01639 [Pseudocohnilembus persalinus]
MIQKQLQVLILSLLLVGTFSQIQVLSPESAVNQFSGNTIINITMGNFGYIPWGQNIAGPLYIPDQKDIHACQPMQTFNMDDFQYEQFPIVMVKRGGDCTFVTKAINVQKAGGKAMVIYDNTYEDSEHIRLGDDGNGDKVYIPVVFISELNGEKLLRAKNQLNSGHVMIRMQFDIKQTDLVSVGFFLSLPDDRGNLFIADYYELIYPHTDLSKVDLYPIYQFYSLYDTGDNYNTEKPNCLGGGKYCCTDPDGVQGTADGRQIAWEQLRQLCVHKALGVENWFKYILEFTDYQCKPQAYNECHKKVMQTLKLSKNDQKDFDQCVENSFENKYNNNVGRNSILEEQIYLIKNSGVVSWPGVHINNITYSGKYSVYPVEDAICAAQLKPSARCKKILAGGFDTSSKNLNEGSSTWGIIFIIVAILSVVFTLVLFLYKKYLRRQMNKEIKGQVNQMVSNYVKFYEARQTEQ